MLSRKNALLTCLLVLIFTVLLFYQACADTLWVDESWHHLSQTMDCDGFQLVVDADVLDVSANTSAQEYHVAAISEDFIRRKMKEVDWSKLGCNTQHLTWYPDEGYLGFSSEEGSLISDGTISTPGDIDASSASAYSLYAKINDGYDDFDNSYEPLGSLTYQDMAAYAQDVAGTCGFQLGKPVRSQRFTDVKGICEAFEKVRSPIAPEAAEGYQFINLFYPVYYQGLRLYSERMPAAPADTQIIPMYLWLTISRDHGLVHVQGPLLDMEQFVPQGQPQRILTEEELLQCVKRHYSNMLLLNTERIRVHTMSVEYVPITGDTEKVESYTLYPVWVLKITYENKNGTKFTNNIGFHAVNGNPLF